MTGLARADDALPATTAGAALVAGGGGLYTLVRDPRPLLPAIAAGTGLVGVGPAGVLVGAVLAALLRRDFAFFRRKRKGHGTRRHLEGRGAARWTLVHCGADGDRDLLRAAGLDVVSVITVPSVEHNGVLPAGFVLPRAQQETAPSVDLGSAVELLTGGEYVRSSGERVDHYFETLGAAHTHDVAQAFAATLPTVVDAVAGVMWGGCYLAAVAAVRAGSRLVLVDPDGLDPSCVLGVGEGGRISDVAFVDDLVNSGTDFRRCERLAANSGTRASFHALYSPHARADLDRHPVAIGHRLVRS